MHVCLIIDVLTAIGLLHGLLYSDTRFRKVLCFASFLYLAYISIHYYFMFARYFGIFQPHPSLATMARADILDFFGGFWTFFGLMVLAKAVTWIALTFAIYTVVQWFAKPKGNGAEPQQIQLDDTTTY